MPMRSIGTGRWMTLRLLALGMMMRSLRRAEALNSRGGVGPREAAPTPRCGAWDDAAGVGFGDDDEVFAARVGAELRGKRLRGTFDRGLADVAKNAEAGLRGRELGRAS